MLHAGDGLYFVRCEDGSVKIRLERVTGAPAELLLSADAWTGIVAGVSARGDTLDTRNEARQFHNRPGKPT